MHASLLLRFAAPILACFAVTAAAAAGPADAQRIAHLIAFGRLPEPGSTGDTTPSQSSLSEQVARHRAALQSDATLREAAFEKSSFDAFGRAPTPAERAAARPLRTYSEWMTHHLQRLASDPTEYAAVLERVYQFVVRREAYPEEIEYWKNHDTLSFVLLVGCVENWARRNQPGLMVTAGTPTLSINSEYLSTLRVSRAVAEEARAVVGLPPLKPDSAPRHVIAPGAAKIASSGGIHVIVVGRPNLISGRE